MKFPLFLFLVVIVNTSVSSQNKQFIYGFQDIPQSLLENPGGEVFFDKHIGIPFLSGVYLNVGTNNGLISGLFTNDGVAINNKFQSIIHSLSTKDFFSVNEQLDIVNIGYRLQNEKDYLSFGIYQEFDFISYHPKDIAILFYQGNTDGNGNTDLNSTYALNDANIKGEMIGVFHAGISRRVNNKFTIGARAKLYSGVFNFQSHHNRGLISSRLDQGNNVQHLINNADVTFNSSGLTKSANKTFASNTFRSLFFGGNLGLGLDVGFTYRLKDNMTLSASLLDLGFISYSNDVNTYKVKGDVEINGIGVIDPPTDNTLDYWENLNIDFHSQVPIDTLHSTYLSFRSPKINTSFMYKFGRYYSSLACNDSSKLNNKTYKNEVGIQSFFIFRPIKPQMAASLFYTRRLSNIFKAKIMYTADAYTFSNIGLGLSSQLGKFNLFAAADNVLGYSNIYSTKKISFSFGMNLVFE